MSSIEVWKGYVVFTPPTFKGGVAKVVSTFRDEVVKLLDKKNANPLAAASLSAGQRDALQKLSTLEAAVQSHNAAVDDPNKLIEAFKRSATPGRLQSAQNELKWLQLTRKRHEQPLVKLDTTALYTRVATKTIREIISPLDRIRGKIKEGAEPPA